jgi:HK97 family phage prohead protease
MEPESLLLQELTSQSPTCRRGEGFADHIEVDDAGLIRGRAVPYGVTVELTPNLREEFRRGAFARQVKDPTRVRLCLEHGQVIGRIQSMEERADGLYFAAAISGSPDIPEAKRARALIAEGLADELSVGFNTVRDGTVVSRADDGHTLAVHHRARLMEISLVPWGAYAREAVLQRSGLVDLVAETMLLRRAEAAERLAALRARMLV